TGTRCFDLGSSRIVRFSIRSVRNSRPGPRADARGSVCCRRPRRLRTCENAAKAMESFALNGAYGGACGRTSGGFENSSAAAMPTAYRSANATRLWMLRWVQPELPVVGADPASVPAGGQFSFSDVDLAMARRRAQHVDQILGETAPGDLPAELST